jgi:hypothetical protein
MTNTMLEKRLAALEEELARLRELVERREPATEPSWRNVAGAFADDPGFAEAMRLGQQYRESLRPKRLNRVED